MYIFVKLYLVVEFDVSVSVCMRQRLEPNFYFTISNHHSHTCICTKFAVRGGRGLYWRTNKNVIRRIRYRWYLRNRMEKELHTQTEMHAQTGSGGSKKDIAAGRTIIANDIPQIPIQDMLLEQYTTFTSISGEEPIVKLIPKHELSAPAKAFLAQAPLEAQDMYEGESDITR